MSVGVGDDAFGYGFNVATSRNQPLMLFVYEAREAAEAAAQQVEAAIEQAVLGRSPYDVTVAACARPKRTGQGVLAVKPDAAETYWQRFLTTYRFRRNFGRKSWWDSFWGAIRAAWRNREIKVEKAITVIRLRSRSARIASDFTKKGEHGRERRRSPSTRAPPSLPDLAGKPNNLRLDLSALGPSETIRV